MPVLHGLRSGLQLCSRADPLLHQHDVVGDAGALPHRHAVAGGDVGLLEAAGVERARPARGGSVEGIGRGLPLPGGVAQVTGNPTGHAETPRAPSDCSSRRSRHTQHWVVQLA